MKDRRSVALLIETSNAYSRGVLDGIAAFARDYANWSIYLPEQERGAAPPKWLSRWTGDGIIARIESEDIGKQMEQLNIPIVDVSAARRLPEIPWVETDDESVATLVSDHLIDRGFKHFAFCGDPGFNWSVWRQQHFEQFVTNVGYTCHTHESIPRNSSEYSWTTEKKRMSEWLSQLPRPIGIMACYDIKAQQLLDVCRELEIAVPEEMAIIGVDDDPLVCNFSFPPLSSVKCNTHRTGFEAALLLDRLMSGEDVGAECVRIKPTGIETRQSTDILAIEDPDIAAAVNFIRLNACSGINVGDVLRKIPLSRSVLESRFRRLIGRTPHVEISRTRIERAKRLLSETDLSLSQVAMRAGFRHDEYLSVAFKKATGVPPSEYRRVERRG